MRDAVYAASSSLTGATGALAMSAGTGDVDGADADGREADGVTFCAMNLRPHATQGGRFEILSALDGADLAQNTSAGFEVRMSSLGASKYPWVPCLRSWLL